jgi:P-type Cu2+ transporter
MSRTLLEALGARGQKLLSGAGQEGAIREYPGLGVVWRNGAEEWSLGKAGWTGQESGGAREAGEGSELRRNGVVVARFVFRDELRPGAQVVVRWLRDKGMDLHIFSGDQQDKVDQIAGPLGIAPDQAIGGLNPLEKEQRMRALGGKSSLFLGDGANDSLAFDVHL